MCSHSEVLPNLALLLGPEVVERAVRLAHGAGLASDRKGGARAGVHAGLVQVRDVKLHGGVVLGRDQPVGPRAVCSVVASSGSGGRAVSGTSSLGAPAYRSRHRPSCPKQRHRAPARAHHEHSGRARRPGPLHGQVRARPRSRGASRLPLVAGASNPSKRMRSQMRALAVAAGDAQRCPPRRVHRTADGTQGRVRGGASGGRRSPSTAVTPSHQAHARSRRPRPLRRLLRNPSTQPPTPIRVRWRASRDRRVARTAREHAPLARDVEVDVLAGVVDHGCDGGAVCGRAVAPGATPRATTEGEGARQPKAH